MTDELHPDDIVRIAMAPNPATAHIWCDALKADGIRCKVAGDYLAAGFGDLQGMKPEVWVHKDDVERATEVLKKGPALGEGEQTKED